MAKKIGENLKGEESTVDTMFSVWGSDNESELDHDVGGLNPAHQGNEWERPELITIKNENVSDTYGA